MDNEPSLSDYNDPHRWDKWFAWDRRRERQEDCPYRTDGDGHVEYRWHLGLGYPTPQDRERWKRRTEYVAGRRAILAAHRDPMESCLAMIEYDRKWDLEHPCPA